MITPSEDRENISCRYLRNGTEVKHTLIAKARQVRDDIRDVTEGVCHQQVQTGKGGA